MSKITQGEKFSSSILVSFSSRVRSHPRTSICKQNTRLFSAPQPRKSLAAIAVSTTPNAVFEGAIHRNTSRPLEQYQSNQSRQPRPQPQSPSLDYSLIGLNGGEILSETLIKHDVKEIFGYPSSSIHSNPFHAVYHSKALKSILPKHEQGAGHMAQGYARATGKPGVVLVTSGSGITNLVTPMQDALCDGTPMVIFCGQSPINEFGMDEFQTADVQGVSKSCTKWNIRVRNIEELPRRINEAFQIATDGRPGPVLVEIPKDVTSGMLTQAIPNRPSTPKSHPTLWNNFKLSDVSLARTLDRIAHLVNIAKKPVLYVGQGMLARPEGALILRDFANKACIPVTTSLQGLGAFDEMDPKALHMLGLHGAGYANLAIQEADLIIALGARFDDRITGSIPKFAPKALAAANERRGGIIHFEIAPKNINKVVQATEAVVGDCATNLEQLIPRIKSVADRSEWFAEINRWKARFPLSGYKSHKGSGKIMAQAVLEKLSDMTSHMKERTVITTGVGQHQMHAAQQFRWQHPRTMITSGGLGTMGYGLPAAIGAKVARPDCLVVDVDGDASFNMTMAELSTAAQYNIGVKVLLFNNEEMGMVSDLQRLYYKGKFVHNRQGNPDFVKAAEAFGVAASRCADPADIETKLRWLLEHDGPALLEIVTEGDCPVWPVVPGGKGLHEFITYPEPSTT